MIEFHTYMIKGTEKIIFILSEISNCMELTAIIKKGEKQYVALCPELDVASQGYTVEDALKNLKEAVELYIEEMGLPEGLSDESILITSFGVKHGKTSGIVR